MFDNKVEYCQKHYLYKLNDEEKNFFGHLKVLSVRVPLPGHPADTPAPKIHSSLLGLQHTFEW